jgi:hypothetical protein
MTIRAVLLPLLIDVLLIFVVRIWMGRVHQAATGSKAIKVGDVTLRRPEFDGFDLSLLFYVLTILAWITRHADGLFVGLAWIFVILRITHAATQATSNDAAGPSLALAAGAVLALMWAVFGIRILLF